MSEENIIIRPETKDDYKVVENLTRESFWNVYQPGCMEHYVLHCYRDDPAFVPELDRIGLVFPHKTLVILPVTSTQVISSLGYISLGEDRKSVV